MVLNERGELAGVCGGGRSRESGSAEAMDAEQQQGQQGHFGWPKLEKKNEY